MYNRSILIGRLTDDPELTTTPNGKNVCNFSLAVDRPYKDDAGNRQADFIPCVAWGKTAENFAAYFAKGKAIGVEGSLQSRSYTGKDGVKRYIVELMVERWFFVESKKGSTPSESEKE